VQSGDGYIRPPAPRAGPRYRRPKLFVCFLLAMHVASRAGPLPSPPLSFAFRLVSRVATRSFLFFMPLNFTCICNFACICSPSTPVRIEPVAVAAAVQVKETEKKEKMRRPEGEAAGRRRSKTANPKTKRDLRRRTLSVLSPPGHRAKRFWFRFRYQF